MRSKLINFPTEARYRTIQGCLCLFTKGPSRRAGEEAAELIEALYARNDWRAAWRYGVYPFPHYHSTAHEVLGVYRGHALIRLGHTVGISAHVEAGDVIVIPAGVGHQNLGSSPDFHVVGGYPIGQSADLLRGNRASDRPLTIEFSLFPSQRLIRWKGVSGPLVKLWGARRELLDSEPARSASRLFFDV